MERSALPCPHAITPDCNFCLDGARLLNVPLWDMAHDIGA